MDQDQNRRLAAAGGDLLCREKIGSLLEAKRIGKTLILLEETDSTNNEVRRLARGGGADGTVVAAEGQTAGRGRMGRPFQSPPGQGIYLSILLRPPWPLAEAFPMTAMTAVAVCDGLEAACGLRPGIKWPNDLVCGGKKLCGILTELETNPEGALSYLVVGVGINVNGRAEDFPEDLRGSAVSLSMLLGRTLPREPLMAAVCNAMDTMYERYFDGRADYLARYRAGCVTLGRDILLLQPGKEPKAARAMDVDDRFALLVRRPDGRVETVSSGEVSVR